MSLVAQDVRPLLDKYCSVEHMRELNLYNEFQLQARHEG